MGKCLNLNCKFIFHNVGQGLFYSGKINNFNFVYDCGSENMHALEKEIENYKESNFKKYNKNTLDMLILSHMHMDHVSGLEKLLSNMHVKTVIIPYFNPYERLLLTIYSINKYGVAGIPEWYLAFLRSPIEYFLEQHEVEKVLVIGEPHDQERNEERNPSDYNDLRIELASNIRLEEEIKEYEGWSIVSNYIKKGKLLIKSHFGRIVAVNKWVFIPFNCKIPLDELDGFRDCLYDEGIRTTNDIKKAIKNKERIKELRNCYRIIAKSLGKSLNNTSLSIFHKPLCNKPKLNFKINPDGYQEMKKNYNDNMANILICLICSRFIYPIHISKFYDRMPITFSPPTNRFGQLLTGDLDLKYAYYGLIKRFGKYLGDIIMCQIPHHGSKKNWTRKILNCIHSDFWVFSAGYNNRYNHPSIELIFDILKENCFVLPCNEFIKVIINING